MLNAPFPFVKSVVWECKKMFSYKFAINILIIFAPELLIINTTDMKKTAFFTMLVLLLTGCSSTLTVDNTPIKALNLNRYLGEWYEIARFDHRFERGMEQTKAVYSLNADGTINVTNSGIKSGKPKVAKGKAKLTKTPALLRVSFFGPFYADYRIMLLDKDYRYALIGSGSDDYLWILSRSPQLTENQRKTILNDARRRGYDISKLIWVSH